LEFQEIRFDYMGWIHVVRVMV